MKTYEKLKIVAIIKTKQVIFDNFFLYKLFNVLNDHRNKLLKLLYKLSNFFNKKR